MITTLTFDLDDTLWSVRDVIGRAEEAMFKRIRDEFPAFVSEHDVASFAAVRQQMMQDDPSRKHNLRKLRRDALALEFARLDHPDADAAADQISEYFQRARQQVNFWPGVLDSLAHLSQHFTLLAITNGTTDILASKAGAYFSGAYRADQFARGKPAPDMFEKAMQDHDFSASQAMHIGDHWLEDIQAAKSLGFQTAWISNQVPPGPEADHCLASVTDLPGVLGLV